MVLDMEMDLLIFRGNGSRQHGMLCLVTRFHNAVRALIFKRAWVRHLFNTSNKSDHPKKQVIVKETNKSRVK